MEVSNSCENDQIGRIVSGADAVDFTALPEGCVANILSLTTPPDAGRLASVSPIFRLAADSDAVWDRFLPPDYQTIISRSDSDPAVFSRKKDMFLSLCQNPILIDDGTKSFSLDKQSGKKCFMLAARDLKITWGDTPQYWGWTSLPESRFPEVAQLIYVWWLEIRGIISTQMLSPATTYAAYLVFKMAEGASGFDICAVKVSVGTTVGESYEQTVCLKPAAKERPENQVAQSGMIGSSSSVQNEEQDEYVGSNNDEIDEYGNSDYDDMVGLQHPKERRDGWLEIELGEVFNGEGEDCGMEMSIMEIVSGNVKRGLIVEGIEVRPK